LPPLHKQQGLAFVIKLGSKLLYSLKNPMASGGKHILERDVFPIGSRVRVADDSSLNGLQGTIIAINMIATPGKQLYASIRSLSMECNYRSHCCLNTVR